MQRHGEILGEGEAGKLFAIHGSMPAQNLLQTYSQWLCSMALCLLCFTRTQAQANLSGDWQGITKEDTGNGFSLVMHLEQRGDSLLGSMQEISQNDRSTYALKRIGGRLYGDSLQFTDLFIINENSEKNVLWCRKTSFGKLIRTGEAMRIEGSWMNEGEVFRKTRLRVYDGDGCRPGNFILYKIKIPDTVPKPDSPVVQKQLTPEEAMLKKVAARKSTVSQRIEVFSDSLTLLFYDNGEIDGDTITVIYNARVLFAHKGLTATPLLIKVPVAPGSENKLLMFADNEGSIPPNTALLIFYDGKEEHAVHLDADEGKNAVVIISEGKKK